MLGIYKKGNTLDTLERVVKSPNYLATLFMDNILFGDKIYLNILLGACKMVKVYERKGRKWLNEYFDNGEYIIIKMSKMETNEEYEVFIDKEDFERVREIPWCVTFSKYKRVTPLPMISSGGIQIHQLIMDSKGLDKIVDHINHNRFDNRKSNLRLVTPRINSMNKKSIKGYAEYEGNYRVYINVNSKTINLGVFKTKEEAECMYLKANMVLGYDKVKTSIEKRIKELGITITEEDIIYVQGRITGEVKTKSNKGNEVAEEYYTLATDISSKLVRGKINCRGYRYEKETNKYLARITIDKRMINIGRYENEKEANDIFLKCCLVVGEDRLSEGILQRIKENNITLTEEDMSNKYIIKIKHILNKEEIPKELNGRFKLEYLKYMGIVDNLRKQGKTWYFIERYLVNEGYAESANSVTIKRYYEEYFG